MGSEDNEVVSDYYPHFRIYKSGRVERFHHLHNMFFVPPSPQDPHTGVSSKDIPISSFVSARLYLPTLTPTTTHQSKIPIIVFYHGGGLVLNSAFFNKFHRFLNLLVSQSNSIAVSVEYRLAPEHDLSTVYEDSWTALQWVTSSQDSWLKTYGDFNRVFLVGESGGANIVFNLVMRAGRRHCGVNISGAILACPYFLIPHETVDIENLLAYKLWVSVICPKLESGLSPLDCPMINPLSKLAPNLSGLGCSKLFMCICEKDELVPGQIEMKFVEGVKRSGWNGELVLFEVEGEGHSFFIENPECEKARDLITRFASFIQSK